MAKCLDSDRFAKSYKMERDLTEFLKDLTNFASALPKKYLTSGYLFVFRLDLPPAKCSFVSPNNLANLITLINSRSPILASNFAKSIYLLLLTDVMLPKTFLHYPAFYPFRLSITKRLGATKSFTFMRG